MDCSSSDWSLRIAGCVLAIAISTATLAAAEPQPEKMALTFTEIKPEKTNEYGVVRKEWSAAMKKSGLAWARFWEPGAVGSLHTYVQVFPIAGFAAFDGPSPIRRALNDTDYERLVARLRDCSISVRREVIEPVSGLGFRTEGSSGLPLAMIVEITLYPGRRQAFLDLTRNEIMPALKKAQVRSFQAYQVLAGTGSEKVYGVIGLANYASLEGGNFLEQGLGVEGARKLNEKYAGLVLSISRIVLRLNPELSFGAPSAAFASGSR